MRPLIISMVVAALVPLFAAAAGAGVVNTVHNLSTTGPGAIKATEEAEICIFCHVPHNANPAVPLWNHDMSGAAYTMYDSEYLKRAGYPTPSELGAAPAEPGFVSRLCLSCHDGTVAVGALYIVRGTILGDSIIAMTGVEPTGEMPATAAGYIGTDLTRHHPVGIKYDSSIAVTFGSAGSGVNPRPIELHASPAAPLKVYAYATGNYVECASCHDAHVENEKFLRVTTGANLAAKIDTTCNSCHSKIDWNGSIHSTSTASYTDSNVLDTFGTGAVASLACMNCHRTHRGGGVPYLLRQPEENTCFQGAAGSAAGGPCHGTGAAGGGKDIETVITRTYSHPTTGISGVHTNLDVLYPEGGTPPGSKGLVWDTSKHAECVDCHNPHRAAQGTHAPSGQWYPSLPAATTNTVSNALKGVTGVEPEWPSAGIQPVNFTTLESASKEYQICLKCHSYYALGVASDGVTSYPTLSDPTINFTDQAWEFNPNNLSVHPVVVTLNSQTGSYAPQALTSSQLSPPWTAPGNQTMYCSDCHGAENETTQDPKGPHGSSYEFMLKGTGRYWPTKPDGSLWLLNTTDASDPDLFCRNCHPIYDGSWKNNVHSQQGGMGGGGGGGGGMGRHRNRPCVNCHVAVPHGSRRSRLIGYASDPSPYNYNGNSLKPVGFAKASGPFNYDDRNCSFPMGVCHGPQTPPPGGYDP